MFDWVRVEGSTGTVDATASTTGAEDAYFYSASITERAAGLQNEVNREVRSPRGDDITTAAEAMRRARDLAAQQMVRDSFPPVRVREERAIPTEVVRPGYAQPSPPVEPIGRMSGSNLEVMFPEEFAEEDRAKRITCKTRIQKRILNCDVCATLYSEKQDVGTHTRCVF